MKTLTCETHWRGILTVSLIVIIFLATAAAIGIASFRTFQDNKRAEEMGITAPKIANQFLRDLNVEFSSLSCEGKQWGNNVKCYYNTAGKINVLWCNHQHCTVD